MQKAGTGWLYDTLAGMPGVCVHPIKEFHHFDYRLSETGVDVDQHEHRLRRSVAKYAPQVPAEDRMPDFEARLNAYLEAGCSDEGYLNLFSTPEGQIAGDFTPAYSILDSTAVGKVKAVLPEAKILLLIRHPVDRAWSQYTVNLRGEARAALDDHAEDLRRPGKRAALKSEMQTRATAAHLDAFLQTSELTQRGFPTRIYDTWRAFYPDLHVIGFDDITRRPERVTAYLYHTLLPGSTPRRHETTQNRKQALIKIGPTDEQRDILERYFAEEIARCRETFPDQTRDWRA